MTGLIKLECLSIVSQPYLMLDSKAEGTQHKDIQHNNKKLNTQPNYVECSYAMLL